MIVERFLLLLLVVRWYVWSFTESHDRPFLDQFHSLINCLFWIKGFRIKIYALAYLVAKIASLNSLDTPGFSNVLPSPPTVWCAVVSDSNDVSSCSHEFPLKMWIDSVWDRSKWFKREERDAERWKQYLQWLYSQYHFCHTMAMLRSILLPWSFGCTFRSKQRYHSGFYKTIILQSVTLGHHSASHSRFPAIFLFQQRITTRRIQF